jgi:biopolymer transport protein ExbD
MAFASFDSKSASAPMADINMVPLIDVMLVLLVIFIITAPLLTHAVKLELPRASAPENRLKPDKIDFAIDAVGVLLWNGEPVSRAEAAQRFAAESLKQPQPEVHLRADQAVAYRVVAQTLADASRAGLTRIGFVSEPEAAR